MLADLPRGIRNNNPGNIDQGPQWQGLSTDQTDPRFCVFASAEMGIRALCKVLLTYYRRYGLKTVHDIIGRWAPPSENDTTAYVAHVAQVLGVGTSDHIAVDDPATLEGLAAAIIAHENANYAYPPAVLERGVNLALTA